MEPTEKFHYDDCRSSTPSSYGLLRVPADMDLTPYLKNRAIKERFQRSNSLSFLSGGNGTLHLSRNVFTFEALLKDENGDQQRSLICELNFKGQSLLHTAAINNAIDIIQYVFSDAKFKPYIDVLLDSDCEGNSPLHLIDKMHIETLSTLLECIAKDGDRLRNLLRKKNNDDLNIFHITAKSLVPNTIDTVWELVDCLNTEEYLFPDKQGNHPGHYLAALQHVKSFGDFIMRLPLQVRRSIVLTDRNKDGLRCIDIVQSWCPNDRSRIMKSFNYMCAREGEDELIVNGV